MMMNYLISSVVITYMGDSTHILSSLGLCMKISTYKLKLRLSLAN